MNTKPALLVGYKYGNQLAMPSKKQREQCSGQRGGRGAGGVTASVTDMGISRR